MTQKKVCRNPSLTSLFSPVHASDKNVCVWKKCEDEVSFAQKKERKTTFGGPFSCSAGSETDLGVYLATAALRTWVRKKPPLVLSMTCW